LVACKIAINPSVTNGAITVAAEMRFPRWFEPYICLALAPCRVADDGTASRLVLLRKSRSLRDLSQEPVSFVFGFVTMSVMMVATQIAIVVVYVED